MKKILPALGIALAAVCSAGAQTSQVCTAQINEDYLKHSAFYQQRATLFDVLPVDSTNIVMLGNSITNGCEWHELFNNPKVINRGISGDIVEGIEDRLAPIVNGHPAKIFLMIGVNDISHHLTVDSIASSITALVQHIRQESPQTELYVQSLLPYNNDYGRYKGLATHDTSAAEINAILKETVPAAGATYIDLYSLMVNDEGKLRTDLSNDGLHLLGPAYLIWRDALLPYLR